MHTAYLVMATACLLLMTGATAQLDPTTGYIKPTPGVPTFNPADWNSVYKVTMRDFPVFPPGNHDAFEPWINGWSGGCNTTGFDTIPISDVQPQNYGYAAPKSCFYKRQANDTLKFDYWAKEHGLAYEMATTYCYALNHFEGYECRPGYRNESSKGNDPNRRSVFITCPGLHSALLDDGAVHITRDQALSGQPETGHYIAMMARPEPRDIGDQKGDPNPDRGAYLALRKDTSGTWSYKPGHWRASWSPTNRVATDRDLTGAAITDPETARLPERMLLCGYYWVDAMKMPLGRPRYDSDVKMGPLNTEAAKLVKSHKEVPGVTVEVSMLPYNHKVAGDREPTEDERVKAQSNWERFRGSKEYEEWKQEARKYLKIDEMPKPAGNSTAESSSQQGGSAPATEPAAGRPSSGRKLMINT